MDEITLDVYVEDTRVGVLASTPEGLFVFTYLPETAPEHLVSLTMPVRAESYKWNRGGVPPFFRMNLPEGTKKDLIRQQLGGVAQVTDIGLLALTGRRTIGRVRCVPRGQSLEVAEDNLQVATLLSSPDARGLLLAHLEAGVIEGVSGVMPKLLREDKTTTATDEYIVKTGRSDVPSMAINELLCLLAASRAGLDMHGATLSDDGTVLAIKRFDRAAGKPTLAVEDFCSLEGLDPEEKYHGSLEGLAARLRDYVPPERYIDNAMRLFKLLLLNCAVRNADAHLKNYALIYTSFDDVELAPVYDVLTVTVYDRWANDIPALTLEGKKVWACGKSLQRFAAQRLGLSPQQRTVALESVETALQATFPDIKQYAEKYPYFRETAKRMLNEWETGLAGIQPTATAKQPPPGAVRESLGMSEVEPERKPVANPYVNQDGAFSHKAR